MNEKYPLGKATRLAYGEALAELGDKNKDIVVLDADLSKSTMSNRFQQKFPERFFNIGISEANMVSIAAGLSATGKIPFASSFATFLMSKGFDQMRQSVAYPGFNVKLCGSHSGISIGEDGPSQMGIEDLALACALPGFTVVVPADEIAMHKLLPQIADHKGPVYIRTSRPKSAIIYQPDSEIVLGQANILRDGTDFTFAAMGLMVAEALKAADILSEKGIEARVVDFHTLQPMDREMVERCAQETGGIIVVEEHLLNGGLGSIIARVVTENHPARMAFIGLEDYAESATPDELLDRYGLKARHLVDKALRFLNRDE
ncbi:MAG TPA: transketolase family protein [Caldithrix abyssi]|uniref:Transketolase family protein n=1 Tax=Caldithrix abyssi TaxID=187145 RepID=A0A7V5UFX9_CALAY|nr:transketolase family protein [Caldithrix abyssi]